MKTFEDVETPNTTWEDGKIVFDSMCRAASTHYNQVTPENLEAARHYAATQVWLDSRGKEVQRAIAMELRGRKSP